MELDMSLPSSAVTSSDSPSDQKIDFQAEWIKAKVCFLHGDYTKCVEILHAITDEQISKELSRYRSHYSVDDMEILKVQTFENLWINFSKFRPYFFAITAEKMREIKIDKAFKQHIIDKDGLDFLNRMEKKLNEDLDNKDEYLKKARFVFPDLLIALLPQSGMSFCKNYIKMSLPEFESQVTGVSRSTNERRRALLKGKAVAKKDETKTKLLTFGNPNNRLSLAMYEEDASRDTEETSMVRVPKALQSQSAESCFLDLEETRQSEMMEDAISIANRIMKGETVRSMKLSHQERESVKAVILLEKFKHMGFDIPREAYEALSVKTAVSCDMIENETIGKAIA